MGSFASTCCVSGLPIESGDPVRWFVLASSPYDDFNINARWFPRTWPIRAKYNDYGSVEDIEAGPIRDVILEGLQADLVEVGVGDNSVHDQAVRKDMSFGELVDALRIPSDRVRVQYDATPAVDKALHNRRAAELKATEDYIPTLQNVEAVLKQSEIPVGGRWLVDEHSMWVRVRWDANSSGHYGEDDKWLREAARLFTPRFAVVVTAGSGSYAKRAELRVFVAPGQTTQGHDRRSSDGREDWNAKTLTLAQAMIREDVWQGLIGMKVEGSNPPNTYKPKKLGIVAYRRGVRAWAKAAQSEIDEIGDLGPAEERREFLSRMCLESLSDKHLGAYWLSKNALPFCAGLATHAQLLLKKGPLPKRFLSDAAEFAFVHAVLVNVRYTWQPTLHCGPQDGEWQDHANLHFRMAEIAMNRLREKEKDLDE